MHSIERKLIRLHSRRTGLTKDQSALKLGYKVKAVSRLEKSGVMDAGFAAELHVALAPAGSVRAIHQRWASMLWPGQEIDPARPYVKGPGFTSCYAAVGLKAIKRPDAWDDIFWIYGDDPLSKGGQPVHAVLTDVANRVLENSNSSGTFKGDLGFDQKLDGETLLRPLLSKITRRSLHNDFVKGNGT